MSSKFSNDLANGMDSILKDSKFQRIFSKTASVKTAAGEEMFDLNELGVRYPDAFNALLDADKLKFQDYKFFVNSAGRVCAKAPEGTDEYLFSHSPDRAPTWMKIAETTESAFNSFASKKKKEDEEDDEEDDKKKKSDKSEKSDKKSDKKSKKDDDKDDEDEDKDDKKSKKSKKDDDKDEDDKDDKKKDKKKSFPFFKKKKAGESCKKDCDCEDCSEVNDSDDVKYANAIRHIVESFTVTSDVLDNMGLEKSAVATMAILDHIISEAATIKFAKESQEAELKEKMEDLKAKFKKMHIKDENYDADAAKELDEKITKLEDKLKDLKKKDLKTDENDVRGTDLLLGLEDQEAHEGFLDPEIDDPKSSAVLEDIFSKNPKLVDHISSGLKTQFGDKDIEKQLRERIQSRLPEVVHTPEDTNIDAIMNAYHEARNIPGTAKLPGDFEKGMSHDPLKTHIDQLNADDGSDIVTAYTLIDEWTKNAHKFEDDSDNEINIGDVESILDVLGNYTQDEIADRENSFKHPKGLNELTDEFYDEAMKHDKNSAEDSSDFGLKELEKDHPEAYEALPDAYKNDSALVFFIDKNGNLCAEGDFGTSNLEEFLWVSDTNEWVAIK